MPVKPLYEWEQTDSEVLLRVSIKGFKKDAIDVFLSDLWVKVNAPPTYLLSLDLLHPIDVGKSTHFIDPDDRSCLRLKLRKQEPGVWSDLCIDTNTCGADVIRERREGAMKRVEEDYNRRLQERAGKREEEKRRMTEEQWEVDKAQRRLIESRVKEEKTMAEESLYSWEDEQKRKQQEKEKETESSGQIPRCPGDILVPNIKEEKESVPSVRHVDTVNIPIDFTPKLAAMPTRSRGEEEYYRRSRYKPTRIEDSPMFWKEKADKHYQHREWKAAADAYTESIKRDGAFLTCVSNRAACFIHLFEYKKAIEDCTLALTMLSNTPASELTQERYRYLMMKLHARRGAAYCWGQCYERGIEDLRVASAYCNPGEDTDVLEDYKLIEKYMKDHGLVEKKDPLEDKMREASLLYYQGKYAEAAALYREILKENPYEVKARNNLSATLLQQGLFKEALEEASHVLDFCKEVAEALSCPGALSTNLVDSDDDDDDDNENSGEKDEHADEMIRQRNAAARKVGEQSGHVYALLKACVRGAAAHCGLKDYRKALLLLEQAVRITPYDDDLQDDYNRVTEKLRMETLVAASARESEGTQSKKVDKS
ncbi:TPR Domain containing protein [Trypanosoma theileri]|uniref:Dynein axonemal assembly factor 4 n=1 Tax=Trypanosoma theileri TaxID=67003 RepID=A0A1X0NRQ0_9TRYP|nr:TPR Domain containing protein [Trypanosoma theileri]ORC87367.1 TPR Domain containing protein [Trypanosoma theileri]